jgi:hypothetical protein
MNMGNLYVCGLILLLSISAAPLGGQSPCEDSACCKVCRGDDSLEQKCTNRSFMLAACADLSPPPIVHVSVTYNNERVESILYAQILVCMSDEQIEQNHKFTEIVVEQLAVKEVDRDRNCYWYPAPACWGECADSMCDFTCNSLWFFRKFKLAIYVPQLDKVFISGEMEMKKEESFYAADLLPDGTIDMKETVKSTRKAKTSRYKIETTSKFKAEMFIKALGITLLIEMLIALIYINIGRTAIPRHLKIQARLLSTVFLANIISLPVLWFIFPSIWNSFLMVILGEVFVVLFEGVLIHFLNKTVLPLKSALLFSFILNMGSLFLGYPIYFILV